MDNSINREKTLAIKSDSSVNVDDMSDITLLSLKEVMSRLGIKKYALAQLINTNKLRVIQLGHRKMVSLRTLREFVRSREITSERYGNYGGG